ncbi:MAG: ABC transporter ATP-binding protein [Acidobacteriota bacterium]|nr:ABC transporter ATP-binding protein [Acidobacteriota bacterium]
MSESVVSVEGVGKSYRLRHHHDGAGYQTLRETLASAAAAPFRRLAGRYRPSVTVDDFWALRDASFEVGRGDVMGIIGRNGAGKSTLLKILSRITEPTTGRVTIGGRLASLLEVGTGFHPELSGRENIFLNGAILGMTRREIARQFDSIVAFAEVEQFLDTPVKRYSSGMYVRLAFAVAAHLEPDVLVVDEVLAVGDAEFQKKSLGKMHEVSRGGRTVLFVSHNMAAIQALCNRAVWLDHGSVAAVGGVHETIAKYLSSTQTIQAGLSRTVPIGEALELTTFTFDPNPVASGAAVEFVIAVRATGAVRINELAVLIYSTTEVRVAIVDLRAAGLPAVLSPGEARNVRGRILSLPLVEGDYRMGLYVGSSDFIGDLADLAQLTVHSGLGDRAHTPYPAEHRGLLELEFRIH